MTEYAPQSPDLYFSGRALGAAVAAGAIAVESDLDELGGLMDFVNVNVTREPFPGPDEMTFVAMFPSKNPFRSEPHLYRNNGHFPLFGPERLAAPSTEESATLQDLVVAGRDILEFRPWTWTGSMTSFIARRALGPPPDEAKMVASARAWQRQASGLSTRDADRLEAEAARRFPNAVVLRSGSRQRVG
jgi:hypothetical protein